MQDGTDNYRKKRIILFIVICAIFGLAVIAGVVMWIIRLPLTASFEVKVAPANATITVNGESYKNKKTYRVKPGNYTADISANGFESTQIKLNLEDGDAGRIYACLKPAEGNEDYYRNNADAEQLCFEIDEIVAEQRQNEQLSDPIYQITPYHSYEKGFNIDPKHPTEAVDGKIVIKIQPLTCIPARAEGLKQNAIEWLIEQGINLDNYVIEDVDACQNQ